MSPALSQKAQRRFVVAALVLVTVIILYFAVPRIILGEPPVRWHQKLTVTVETPNGVRVGSAVQAVRAANASDGLIGKISPIEARGGSTILQQGEAVVVALDDGRYLFMLLGGVALIGQRVLDWPEPYILTGAKAISRFEGVAPVPPDKAPLLVTFDDINDPASVKRVDPANLARTFGRGYALKSIMLEITDEPVTTGKVEKVLGWMGEFKGRIKPPSLRLGPGLHSADSVLPEEKLTKLEFIRGN